MKFLLPWLGATLLATTSCTSPSSFSNPPGEPWLAHDVYFDLHDDSPATRKALIRSCWEKLSKIDGVRFFACGGRDESLASPVNDVAYDISLHVVFESRAAHDAYQTHADHVAFVEEHKEGWKGVRVFDSLVDGQALR